MSNFKMEDYVEVPERILEFRKKFPEGVLQSEILELPAAFATEFLAVKALAYRTPDDPRPGVGIAWERVPGRTPYTKDSELMNAETSAWGRAIVAVGAADTKRGIATASEIKPRQAASQNEPKQKQSQPVASPPPEPSPPAAAAQGFPTVELEERAEAIRLRKEIRNLDPQQRNIDFSHLPGLSIAELQALLSDLQAAS